MIKINDTYFIKSDGNSYALVKDMLTHDKKGNRIYKDLGYYGNLKDALNGYAKKRVLCESFESEMDLKDVKRLLEDIHNEIKKVIA